MMWSEEQKEADVMSVFDFMLRRGSETWFNEDLVYLNVTSRREHTNPKH